jgi:hypothetical protein
MGALISTQFYKKSVLSAVYNLTYKFQFITFFGFDKNFVNYFEASLERMSIFWKMQFESIFFYSELESKFPYIIQIIFEVWFLFWDWAKFLNNYFLTKKYTWFIFGLRFFFSKMHIKIWKQFASRVLIPFNFFFSFLNVLFVKKFSFTFDFWNIFLLKQKEFSEIRNGKKKFLFFFFFNGNFFCDRVLWIKKFKNIYFLFNKSFFFFSKINTISYLYFYLNRIGGASANSLSRVCLFSYLNFSFKNYFMSKFLFQQKFGHWANLNFLFFFHKPNVQFFNFFFKSEITRMFLYTNLEKRNKDEKKKSYIQKLRSINSFISFQYNFFMFFFFFKKKKNIFFFFN